VNLFKETLIGALDFVLPKSLKNSLLHVSYHLAPREFERFAHRYCIAPNMAFGLQTLAARGFSPRTIVDVGAYEGGWSLIAHDIWPNSCVVMVEPNHAKKPQLLEVAAKLSCRLYDDLLGANSGQSVAFNVMGTGSSVLSENSLVDRVVETRALSTLDALSLALEGDSNLLKIDAQGYELEILKGAANSIKSFEAVLLEVAIIEINDGAPLLHEVTAFMDSLGFIAGEILEIHRRPLDGAMSQIDVIFIRKGSKLLADRRYSN
jgi:FkbM family methyltransferase